MGICLNKSKSPEVNDRQPSHSHSMKHTQSMPAAITHDVQETDKLVKRSFTVLISNLKIKSPPQLTGLSMHMNFDGQVKKVLPLTDFEGTLRWKQQFEFEYSVDDFRLKQQAFCILNLKNESDIDLGSAKIQLINVATGPYHHDLAVSWKSQLTPQKLAQMKSLNIPNREITDGRMSFDLKMFQKIEFCITADSIISTLNQYNDNAYNFSFRLITLQNTYNSEHSENNLNPALQKKTKDTTITTHTTTIGAGPSQLTASQEHTHSLPAPSITDNLDEDFNADMNENAEALKISNKTAKSNSHYQPLVITPINSEAQRKSSNIEVNRTDLKKGSFVEANKQRTDQKKGSIIQAKRQNQKRKTTLKPTNSLRVIEGNSIDASGNQQLQNSDAMKETQSNLSLPEVIEEQVIQWEYLGNHTSEPPELIVKLTTKDIGSTSLQICIWGLHSMEPLEKKDEAGNIIKYMDNHIVGECYISINRLFSQEPQMVEVKGQKVQVRKKEIQERLWNHGKEIGQILSNFKVINHEYLQQMIVGVQTEDGISKASPAIYNLKQIQGQSSHSDIEELNQAKNQLIDNVYSLYVAKSVIKESDKERIKDDIQTNFKKIHDIAQRSDKESVQSFCYKSQEDLLQSQSILIDIANHLLQYADDIDETLREGYYDCLKIIINRGEFDLNYMGFDDSYIVLLDNAQGAQIKKGNFNKENLKKLNSKMKVALSYQKLLYTTLEKVLIKLTQKALSDKERQFVENYCAVAYFRIPEFREKLLSVIAREDDIEITEWRGTEYALDEKKNGKLMRNNEFISLFDWEFGFYRFLKTQELGEQHFMELEKNLNDAKWSKRLAKRGVAFFFFLTEWLQYVSKTVVVKEHVPWQDLPGYLVLLKAFLVELKTREILQYSEAIKITSQTILNNEKLLNPLISLLYNKTNVYDSAQTVCSFELINSWMRSLSDKNKSIPTVFDFSFFFKGISLVLAQDHSGSIAHVIWVIYNNFLLFPPDFQREICEYFFSPIFCKFFMHWSFNVRMIFQYFLVYRIHHLYETPKTKYQTIEDLKRQILNNANHSERKNILIHDLIHLLHKKMMNVIETAKKKYIIQTSKRYEELTFYEKMKSKLLQKQEMKFYANSSSQHRNSSQSILEISFTQENERIKEEILARPNSNILDDLNSSLRNSKDIQKGTDGGDMLLDLFDGVEIEQIQKTQSDISQIKHHLMRATAHNNQQLLVLQKEDEYGEYSGNQLGIRSSEKIQAGSASATTNTSGFKPQIVYHHTMFHQSEKIEEEFKQLESEYLKYISQASIEFEETKHDYEIWLNQKISLLPSLPKEKKLQIIRKFDAPEVYLRATTDESEVNFLQVDEW